MLRRLQRNCIIVLFAVSVCALVLRVSTQPSLTFTFERASLKKTFAMTLEGKPYEMPYRVYAPADAGPDHHYPVLLYLCGSGQCGTDNIHQAVSDIELLD
ncbi:MAG: hypothetical protein LBJ11_00255 [Oscillospiraceae bacterium]|jgi:predicted peptidase|nr:hypothetical protein [Oscillospiraceae bacterium]